MHKSQRRTQANKVTNCNVDYEPDLQADVQTMDSSMDIENVKVEYSNDENADTEEATDNEDNDFPTTTSKRVKNESSAAQDVIDLCEENMTKGCSNLKESLNFISKITQLCSNVNTAVNDDVDVLDLMANWIERSGDHVRLEECELENLQRINPAEVDETTRFQLSRRLNQLRRQIMLNIGNQKIEKHHHVLFELDQHIRRLENANMLHLVSQCSLNLITKLKAIIADMVDKHLRPYLQKKYITATEYNLISKKLVQDFYERHIANSHEIRECVDVVMNEVIEKRFQLTFDLFFLVRLIVQ